MTFERFVSFISLVWFFGGALWLLLSPEGFVRFASLGTRPSLTPSQLRKARIVACARLVIGGIIVLEFVYGLIRWTDGKRPSAFVIHFHQTLQSTQTYGHLDSN